MRPEEDFELLPPLLLGGQALDPALQLFVLFQRRRRQADRERFLDVRGEEEGVVQQHEVLGLRVRLALHDLRPLDAQDLDRHPVVVDHRVVIFAGVGETDHGGVVPRHGEEADLQRRGEVRRHRELRHHESVMLGVLTPLRRILPLLGFHGRELELRESLDGGGLILGNLLLDRILRGLRVVRGGDTRDSMAPDKTTAPHSAIIDSTDCVASPDRHDVVLIGVAMPDEIAARAAGG